MDINEHLRKHSDIHESMHQIEVVGDKIPLMKEKFSQDYLRFHKDQVSKQVLSDEEKQIREIIEKYSKHRVIQFENNIKESNHQSNISQSQGGSSNLVSSQSSSFNQKVNNIFTEDNSLIHEVSQAAEEGQLPNVGQIILEVNEDN